MKDKNEYSSEKKRGKIIFKFTLFRERRRLGLSAPDNYGGAKENKFPNYHQGAYGMDPAVAVNKN